MTAILRAPVIGLLALGMSVVALGTPASADHRGGSTMATQIDDVAASPYQLQGERVRGELLLSATLHMADGSPLTETPVELYEEVEFFGPRLALVGIARTDAGGAVVFLYRPARIGERHLVVRFPGNVGHRESEARLTVPVSEVVPPFPSEPLPLASVRQWLPLGVGAVVVAVWAVLAAVLLKVIVAIRGGVPARTVAHVTELGKREGR